MVLAPWIFNAPFEQSVLTQIAIAMVACLSYNMLWGQGGMLSFGHAVYTGLGAYMAMHVMQGLGSGGWGVPVSLIPLVGGVCGMGFAVVLGYVSTRKSGTTLAMITLGLGELVFAMSLMFSDFFGGEAGLSLAQRRARQRRAPVFHWLSTPAGALLGLHHLRIFCRRVRGHGGAAL
jgi:branched-chain amino acid transport system permease protein